MPDTNNASSVRRSAHRKRRTSGVSDPLNTSTTCIAAERSAAASSSGPRSATNASRMSRFSRFLRTAPNIRAGTLNPTTTRGTPEGTTNTTARRRRPSCREPLRKTGEKARYPRRISDFRRPLTSSRRPADSALVADRQLVPPLLPARGKNPPPGLACHPRPEAVCIPALPLVRLKCPLHGNCSDRAVECAQRIRPIAARRRMERTLNIRTEPRSSKQWQFPGFFPCARGPSVVYFPRHMMSTAVWKSC